MLHQEDAPDSGLSGRQAQQQSNRGTHSQEGR